MKQNFVQKISKHQLYQNVIEDMIKLMVSCATEASVHSQYTYSRIEHNFFTQVLQWSQALDKTDHNGFLQHPNIVFSKLQDHIWVIKWSFRETRETSTLSCLPTETKIINQEIICVPLPALTSLSLSLQPVKELQILFLVFLSRFLSLPTEKIASHPYFPTIKNLKTPEILHKTARELD